MFVTKTQSLPVRENESVSELSGQPTKIPKVGGDLRVISWTKSASSIPSNSE